LKRKLLELINKTSNSIRRVFIMKNRITYKMNYIVLLVVFSIFVFLLSGCGIVKQVNEKKADIIDELFKEGITINYKAVQDYEKLCKKFNSIIGQMGYKEYYDHNISNQFNKGYNTNLIIDGKEVKMNYSPIILYCCIYGKKLEYSESHNVYVRLYLNESSYFQNMKGGIQQ